jgi:hypothetical protein
MYTAWQLSAGFVQPPLQIVRVAIRQFAIAFLSASAIAPPPKIPMPPADKP